MFRRIKLANSHRATRAQGGGTPFRLGGDRPSDCMTLDSAADALSGVDEESKAGAVYQKLMGALAWSAGRDAEAEQHYNEASRLEPGNRVIMLNLATIHLSSTNEAIARAARLSLEKMATNAELRLPILHELVKEAVLRKSLPRAVAFSEQITRDTGATFGDRVGHLALLRQAGDSQFTSYLQGLKRDATNGPCAYALGRWMVLSEGPTNALRWLQGLPPAVQTEPARAAAHRRLPDRPPGLARAAGDAKPAGLG